MASIESYETKAGRRWRVRYRKPNGHQTDKRGLRRRKDAEQWMAENVITAQAEGSYVDPIMGKIRFSVICNHWLDVHRSLWQPTYIQSVESDMRNHVLPAFATRRISEISRSEVQAFINDLASTYSPTVVLRCFRIVKGVFETARDDGIIRLTRAVEGITLPHKASRKDDRHYLTPQQLVQLANVSGHYRALVLVLGFCGLRWGEAAALMPDDVDLENKRIHVRRKIAKSNGEYHEGAPKSHEIRDVPIPVNLIPVLAEHMKAMPEGRRVFTDPDGKYLRYRSVGKGARGWWIHALTSAGLPMMPPHDLRHTAASIAVSAGANVKVLQRMLGHKSAAMTLDVYADLFDTELDVLGESIGAAMPSLDYVNCGQNVGKAE